MRSHKDIKDRLKEEMWYRSWWRHQMEKFSALLALCAGNSPVPGEFPAQRPVTRSFDVFFDLRPNKRLSKQSWGWWFETPSRSLWRHCNDQAKWQPFYVNISYVTHFLCKWQVKENDHVEDHKTHSHHQASKHISSCASSYWYLMPTSRY